MDSEKMTKELAGLKTSLQNIVNEINNYQAQINAMNQKVQQLVADKVATEGAIQITEYYLKQDEPAEKGFEVVKPEEVADPE